MDKCHTYIFQLWVGLSFAIYGQLKGVSKKFQFQFFSLTVSRLNGIRISKFVSLPQITMVVKGGVGTRNVEVLYHQAEILLKLNVIDTES